MGAFNSHARPPGISFQLISFLCRIIALNPDPSVGTDWTDLPAVDDPDKIAAKTKTADRTLF
jgi:hypothetical protein